MGNLAQEELEKLAQEVKACEDFIDGVASTDVQIGEHVWVRIFLPQSDGSPSPYRKAKKPVVMYMHGGAYCFGQPNMSMLHTFCACMCSISDSIWVSLSYRLAPRHRLPAAYEDAAFALHWLASQAEQQLSCTSHRWLTEELADFSNFFMAGESAGAAIALKVARDFAAAAASPDIGLLSVKGLLLVDPGFHSEEKRGAMLDVQIGLHIDKLYDCALPEGETLDYGPVNPLHPNAPSLLPLAVYPHIFVSIGDKDFRYDMIIRFYELICSFCPDVQLFMTPGKGHVFHIFDYTCQEAQQLRMQLANFIRVCTESL